MLTDTIAPLKTKSKAQTTTLSTAALCAGLGLLVMVIAAPFAELFAYPKLVVLSNVTQTIENITSHRGLFACVIFAYLVTFICDVVVAWALYVFLKPVNQNLSLLTALFRWVYTVVALTALLNLVTVFRLLDNPNDAATFSKEQLNAQVFFLFRAFKSNWYFGLIFFGIHLGLLGYLVIRSAYVPSILGVLLIITGLGYLITTLQPYLFREANVDFAKYTFYGELIFMLWLLIKGWRVKAA